MAAGGAATVQSLNRPHIDFNRDVLPILSDKCFRCHGPDSASRMADLRLDMPQSAYGLRHGEFAIVPKAPKSSLLVQKINDHDDPMPPASSGKTLSPKERQILEQWIQEGAHYRNLWSFEPIPKTVPVPRIASNWPSDDIDKFILVKLTKAGLHPTHPANRERLLRRVTLDLTGLPPTEREITDFELDKKPAAYERVVDRLLASPHFGERLAVEWLDAARYSDSYGYQSDLLSPTWPYRDWVVKAFNQNMPYDKFLTDQLAGDLLPSPSTDQKLATAFNRLHRQSNEGGSIAQEFKTLYVADRVDTFGTAMLGLTVGCARCHDHKFDPISQREYYQLGAYFNSIDEYGLLLSTEIVPTPSMLLPTPAQDEQLEKLKREDLQAKQALTDPQLDARFQAWISQRPTSLEIPGLIAHLALDRLDSGKYVNDLGGKPFGEPIGKPTETKGIQGGAIQFDGDSGLVVRGLPAKERWEPFTWSFWLNDAKGAKGPVVLLHRTGGTDVGFCGFDLLLEDGRLTARVMRHWPGNAVAIQTKQRIPKSSWTHVAWSWDGLGRAAGLKLYLNGKPAETSVLEDKLWKKINAYGDLGPSGGDWSFAQRFRESGFKDGKVDEVSFADRALSDLEVQQIYNPGSVAAILKSPDAHRDSLRSYFASAIDPPSLANRTTAEKAQQALAEYEDGIYEISVMQETPKPIPAYVLARGQYDAPQNDKTRVQRDVPKSLPPLAATGPNNRLALAKWLTRSDNPLAARVAVNRFWQMIFGAGLVETSENFGSQGSQPSHPELLDYLSRQFIDSHWNVKRLIRRLVLSSTYRQDSVRTKQLNEADPKNRLYARGPSARLPAEMLRDTVLAASGILNAKIGGPPVNPYQPAGIWQENNTMSPAFVQSKGSDLFRRSLYSTWKRTTPVPNMMLFDATSREACTVRRPATNTPLQALVLLNDVQFVEAARILAERVSAADKDDRNRIRDMFLRLAGRAPDPTETKVLLETLQEQRELFATDETGAKKLIAMGDSKPANSVAPKELAAMTVTAQTVMNSDAVVWKR
jgi:hypothetical protein